ncbi:MAG: DUF4326 domain-containing protein [Hyphomonadaceae bacterium]|nr:DUF4326 domain-containing protein [Hyphomonadaceae bacterium]
MTSRAYAPDGAPGSMGQGPAASGPSRVQLSRKAGWRMPANTIKVTRPGKWGNPYKVGSWVRPYSEGLPKQLRTVAEVVTYFGLLANHTHIGMNLREKARRELRGKNLACWCPLDQPCHADVLLEIANEQEGHAPVSATAGSHE